ncbi:MAG: helix-turn-helix domain-containing protein [Solirubrobacteraceae bacterium]
MPRVAHHPIVLSGEERRELEARSGRLTAPFREVQRARIVLYAADGLLNREIAGRLDTTPGVVAKWRRRFSERRVEGLSDLKRAGAPRRFPPGGGRAGQGDRVRVAKDPGRSAIALQSR